MAPSGFPLPRAMLPTMSSRPDVHKDVKRLMRRMLEHTIREFETHTYVRNGIVDGNRWKALSKTQTSMNGQNDDNVAVYSEREAGETSTSLAVMLQDQSTTNSALAALTPSAVLVAGRAAGKVENIMYALGGAHTQQGLALFSSLMYGDIADCGILKALKRDSAEDESSCTFLGYKYVVKRSAASAAKLTPHRDVVFLESTGYTQSSNGERLGFLIQHSVDVPGFPDLREHNSSRVLQSVRYLFRQKSERVMEIFMLGNVELAGALASSSGASGGDLLSISRLQQCAEIRRITLMVRRRRESIELLQSSSFRHSSECYLCHRTKRFFSNAQLSECDVCGQFVCSKCRNDKKLFVIDSSTNGLLGKFQRAQTCKTCVLAASAGYAPPPIHMSVSQQVTRNQGDEKASVGSGSMSGRRYSHSSSDRSSSIESSASGELHSCRQGPVYTFPEEDKTPEPTRIQRREHLRPNEPAAATTPPLAISIAKARGRSTTSSSNSSASSEDSESGRSHRGVYRTPPNPSKLYEQERQRRRQATHQHGESSQQRSRLDGNQLVVSRGNCQSSSHERAVVAYGANQELQLRRGRRQLAGTTIERGNAPERALVTPYSNSYSGPSSTVSIAAKNALSYFPHSERGLRRGNSVPMTYGTPQEARRSNLMMQMMELNMKAENTYNATQRNGAFLKHQIDTHNW